MKLALEIIYRVYQVIYWVYQIGKNNILEYVTTSFQKFDLLSGKNIIAKIIFNSK